MKRLINVRFPVLLAIALSAGILLGFLFVYNGINLFWIIAVVPSTAIIFIICALFVRKNYILVMIILAALFLTAGTVLSYLRLDNFSKNEFSSDQTLYITATVLEKGVNSYGEYLILGDARADGLKTGGKIYAYLSEKYGDFCDVGYEVGFTSALKQYDAFLYGAPSYYAQNNIKYFCTVNGNLTAEYGYSFFGSLNTRIRNALYDNLDEDTAAVVFAMLTGNTLGVESGTLESFRYGGIAHIFAVSGLHIGILYAVIAFLCKKLKFNVYISAFVCVAAVFLYVGICGFTLSSLRAAVMCSVMTLTKLLHLKYDGLNALSIAVIFILIATPLSLFGAGFQLSVCAVAAIFLLSNKIAKTLKKTKCPDKICSAVGISLSAQAGVLPVMLADFGYISGAGLILNIVLVPLLSAVFVILFVCTAITSIFGGVTGILVTYSALPLEALISCLINAGFEKTLISGFGTGAFAPVYFLGLVILSDKINLKLFTRTVLIIITVAILSTYTLVFN